MLKKILGSAITIVILTFLFLLGPIDFKDPSNMLHQTNAYGYGSGGGGHSSPVMIGWRPSGTEVTPVEDVNVEETVPAETASAAQEAPAATEAAASEPAAPGNEITGSAVADKNAGVPLGSGAISIIIIAAAVIAGLLWVYFRKRK